MNELEIGIAVAFAAGVLSFLSPCVLPLVPSYLSFVSGVGLEDLEHGGTDVRRTAFLHSLFFVLGFSLVFLALGASATLVGRLLREYQVWIALVGITFGAGWSPCIGPILGGILTFAATRQTMGEGLVLLGFYSAGLAVPFLVSSLALSWFLTTFDRFKKWIPWVERISGVLLVAVGLLLMSGRFTALAAWMTRFTPEFILDRI